MPAPDDKSDRGLWRDLAAYWFLGLCNNYGYVVMLSAAHDIIAQFHGVHDGYHGVKEPHVHNGTKRCCQYLSTGAILLADILPSFAIKAIIPFFPLWVNLRMFVAICFSVASFILVAFANKKWIAFLGVICTSASCGLGESTLLSYSSSFNKNVVSTWSSGTGGAGIFGAISYAGLIQLGLTPKVTMLLFLFVPVLQGIMFWILLRRPSSRGGQVSNENKDFDVEPELLTFKEKVSYTLNVLLVKYMLPLALVYFAEYLINMGLFELVYFDNSFIDHPSQYRWYSSIYQVGVFVSRSSVNIIHFTKMWPMAILQCINTVLFTLEAIYFFTPSIWIVFIMIFYEGLLGGGAYVNTFYLMSHEVPPERRQFALGMVAQSDSYGIMSAGFLSIPVHNAICKLPVNVR